MTSKLRVLIVDDSNFFLRVIKNILGRSSDIDVVGTAKNGLEAIAETKRLKPDVITMDVEMPVMDGIAAVRRIMKSNPTRILMFSSLTSEGTKSALDALEAGAIDFLPKQASKSDSIHSQFDLETVLIQRVIDIGRSRLHLPKAVVHNQPSPVSSARIMPVPSSRLKLIAIGASTGGPLALQQILSGLPENFPLPIVLAVHMPGSFTTAYAERLNNQCRIEVSEAKDRDELLPGHAYVAPGGMQMRVEKTGAQMIVRVLEADADDTFRPSVDVLLGSASQLQSGSVLGLVLTGMGSDGLNGAKKLKETGSLVWTQDQESCVVYGMPQAIDKAGLSDQQIALTDISDSLWRVVE